MKHADIISKLTRRQKADLLSGKDFWSTVPHEDLGLPSAYLSDGPHGLRKQAAKSDHLGLNASIPATCFPTAATMANSWDESLGLELGRALGEEALVQHVNVVLGPGMNIKRNPRCGRNFEYFSEDPYLAGKIAASYVKGIQSRGISACIKHFAANNQEERRMVIDSVVDERALREIYLTGFEIAVKEGKTQMVMSSYNKLNGTHANENHHLLVDILRDEWGFDGVVVTDWAGCNDRVEGLRCGNELEMPSCKYGNDDVFAALENGTLDEAIVDECLDRLIDWVLRSEQAILAGPKTFDVDAHHALALKCAEESIVLLKNEGVLPLTGEEKICVVGDYAQNPRYQGAGSSVVNPTKLDNFLECMQDENHACTYAQGFDRYGKKSPKLVEEALEKAAKADKILFFAGLDEVTEAEGLDRVSIKLPQNQLDLLAQLYKLNKPVVVVLSCGSAVELDNINEAGAIVHGYLGGQAGARAMMHVLYGKVNPSGKLSESLPFRYEDCSSAPYFPGKRNTVEYREGLFVGYRYYDTAGVKVNFPFGFGLSYTTFAYSDLEVEEDGVSFVIKNTGSVAGAEIAQLYVGKENSVVPRPKKELKGFVKVFLEPGEEKRVTIPFDDKTFRYFNVKTDKWEVEGGEYVIYIGASSEDIRLEGAIDREGTTDVEPYDRAALEPYYTCEIKSVSDDAFRAILGREIPEEGYIFYKKNRMVIHENCTVADLRYSRRWVGRLFAWAIRFAHAFLWKTGQKTMANTIIMGVYHQPIRGLAKFGGMTRRQMEAMLMMFNGHLFKGIGKFLTKGKK